MAEGIIQPYCNVLASTELVHKFTLEKDMDSEGWDRQLKTYFELRNLFWTPSCRPAYFLLEILFPIPSTIWLLNKSPDDGCDNLDPSTGANYYCIDDSLPPGGLKSRISGLITEGTCSLVVSSYSGNSIGPMRVFVKFAGDNLRLSWRTILILRQRLCRWGMWTLPVFWVTHRMPSFDRQL